MDEVDRGVWYIVENDMTHGHGVDTSGSQVGSDDDLCVGEGARCGSLWLALFVVFSHLLLLPKGRTDGSVCEARQGLGLPDRIGVAVERQCVDALFAEVLGDGFGVFSLVDEDEDSLRVYALLAVFVVVLARALANLPYTVGTREHLVPAVRVLVYVDNTQLDSARDGVEVRRDQARHIGEFVAQELVQILGDGGAAKHEFLERGRGAVQDLGRGGFETAVEQRVGLVADQMGDAREDIGV